MSDVLVYTPHWAYVALIGAIIFFILFLIFLAYTIYYSLKSNSTNTDAQTNFAQPTFTNKQIVYPTSFGGIPTPNVYDIPTAQLGIAASQSISNQNQNAGNFVPLGDYSIIPTNSPTLALIPTLTNTCPYSLIIAYPDANIFSYADNGSWNQVPWFGLGSINSGIAQLAQFNINGIISLVNSTAPGSSVLFTGHGAGAGAALAVALRVKNLTPGKSVLAYVTGCPKIGDNVWFNNLNDKLGNFWILQNLSDNITCNPLPTMLNSLNGNVFGYTPQGPMNKEKYFTYQTGYPQNNHIMTTYAYALNPGYTAPFNFTWPFSPIV